MIAVLHAERLEKRLNGLPATFQRAETDAENGQLTQAEVQLALAESEITATNSTLYNSPDFALVNLLPVARQNLQAIRRTTSLALQMISNGESVLQVAAPLEGTDGHLDVSLHQGQLPLAAAEQIQSVLAAISSELPVSATPPPERFLIGKVRSAETRVYAEAVQRRSELQSVSSSLKLIDDISGASGDRRYLIAVANTAEMRGAGGMVLSYGVLTSHAGKISLAHFGPIDELALTHPETKVPFPDDFMASFGSLDPTMDWRNVTLMSDFTVDAPVMEAMYEQATGLTLDGVIQVDPAGLAALLTGIGPVQTPDLGTVTAANVVPLTLNQAYIEYPNRTVRQDYTGEAAQATFSRLLSGSFSDLHPLGTALFQAAQERHVEMYANDGADETAIRTLGFAAALPDPASPLAQLTIQNIGGNKLDYYLQSSLHITGSALSEVGSHITATIELHNGAPAGVSQPQEVFGPYNPGALPGQYLGLVTLYLPAHSDLTSSQVDGSVTTGPIQGNQNGVSAITYTVVVSAGGSSQVVLHVDIPPTPSSYESFQIVPTPRVLPTVVMQKLS